MAEPSPSAVSDPRSSGEREARWLEWVCLFFASLGVGLPLALEAPPFAMYRAAVAAAIGDATLLDQPTTRLVVGITGGSIAGKWALHWAIARYGIRARRRWAWHATLAGLLTWLVVDSVSSLLGGAIVNVWMINVLPPALVLPLAWRLRPFCDAPPAPARTGLEGVTRLALASAALGTLSGLVIAFGTESAWFDPWWRGLADAHFGGQAPSAAAHALLRFFAGPIGGSTAGQCVMLAWVARNALSAGERWAWRGSAVSVLVWAGIDSSWSVLSGGAFNVWLVNVPCAVLLLAPLVWAAAREPRGEGSGRSLR